MSGQESKSELQAAREHSLKRLIEVMRLKNEALASKEPRYVNSKEYRNQLDEIDKLWRECLQFFSENELRKIYDREENSVWDDIDTKRTQQNTQQ